MSWSEFDKQSPGSRPLPPVPPPSQSASTAGLLMTYRQHLHTLETTIHTPVLLRTEYTHSQTIFGKQQHSHPSYQHTAGSEDGPTSKEDNYHHRNRSVLKSHELLTSRPLSESRTHTEGSVASAQIAVGVPVSHCWEDTALGRSTIKTSVFLLFSYTQTQSCLPRNQRLD